MKKMRLLSVLVSSLLLISLVGCGNQDASEEKSSSGKGRLQGLVTMPLEGVRLYIYQPGMDLYGPAFAISSATTEDGAFDIELPDGDYVVVKTAAQHVRFLLVSGKPLNEPIARYGPFVMNTQTEIMEALRDAQMGKMGVLIEEF